MAKIDVKFVTEEKVSKAGHPYQIVEMWVTDREGGWPERPTVSIMPFHARLLLQNLPELCLELGKGKAEPAKEANDTDPSTTTEPKDGALPF
jgi:hypothetical protein